MYKQLLFLITITGVIFSQYPPSIHQQQLEYYNATYVLPENIDTAEFIYPISPRTRTPSKEVFGYHPYWMGTAWTDYNFDLISTLAYFSAEATETGSLENLHGWPIASLINEAHAHGIEVVLCVTLFNSNDLVTLLSSPTYRQNLINNLLTQVQAGNADGVNVDFESFPVSQRDNMVTFITDLTSAFHSTIPGSQVTLAMPAVDWSDAWDYNALASVSDGLFIMGYAYHWSGSSTTGPNSPLSGPGYTLTWTVLDYLNKTNYQADKLILGCPYYGFEWPSATNTPGSNTTGTGDAKFYSEIEGLALSYGKLWHQSTQTPWYTYDNSGWNQGWYDDSLSLSLKYDFALYNNLKGIGIWALGYDAGRTELWDLLHAKFGESAPPTKPSRLLIKNIGSGSIKIDFQGAENASEYIVLRGSLDIVGGLDTLGIYTDRPIIIDNLTEGETYFLSIAAKNSLGTSQPSEMLGVVPSSGQVNFLIVNGFDRVSGTSNTFDFIRQHGSSINSNGRAFDSASNEAIIEGDINIISYQFTDWILGEEGTSTNVFSTIEQNIIKTYLESGKFLFISGSEIGYDLEAQGNMTDIDFYQNYLKADYITDAAGGHQGTYSGYGINNSIFNGITDITFDDGNYGTYDVDWPDGIKPIGGAVLCAEYSNTDYDTRGGMGIEYTGTFGLSSDIGGLVYLSVGFETIYPNAKRNEMMSKIIELYDSQLGIDSVHNPIHPSSITIHSIYPNPTNTSLTISFSTTKTNSPGHIIINDLLGRVVYSTSITTINSPFKWTWNGLDNNEVIAPTGTYFVSIYHGDQIQTRKITILK
tara:strand:+ start:1617 stop:4055 length:2439 start_codon:yes stop_codon:yes gene_type:complete